MTKVWIVNSTTDQKRYVTEDRKLADEIQKILTENRDSSETEYFVTAGDFVTSTSELSKYEYIDAETEQGEVLTYFFNDEGEWFRTYVHHEQVEKVLNSLPQFDKWTHEWEDV